MNKLILLYLFSCAVFLPQQSNAALIDKDLNVPGDKALLLDTSTGLEWLDLSITGQPVI